MFANLDLSILINFKTLNHTPHERIQSRGGGGGDRESGHPLKNHKNIGFLSNTGPDPLKMTKLPSQHSMSGHHRYASEMLFRWLADDGPLIVLFESSH